MLCKFRVSKMCTEAGEIGKALGSVIQRIDFAVQNRAKSLPQIEPRLVSVSKTKPVEMIIEAYQHGQRHFGENYVQELAEKASHAEILDKCKDIRWHYIGHLQRNKVSKVLGSPNLYLVETVDTEKLAQTLNNNWEKMEKVEDLNVMVQVNTSGEDSKNGCEPSRVCDMVKFIRRKCPRLKLLGLMTIGSFDHDLSTGPNPDFQLLAQCRKKVCEEEGMADNEVELSMGMSHDFEHAIDLGSTNIRVGSTIFGARNYPQNVPTSTDQGIATPHQNADTAASPATVT